LRFLNGRGLSRGRGKRRRGERNARGRGGNRKGGAAGKRKKELGLSLSY